MRCLDAWILRRGLEHVNMRIAGFAGHGKCGRVSEPASRIGLDVRIAVDMSV